MALLTRLLLLLLLAAGAARADDGGGEEITIVPSDVEYVELANGDVLHVEIVERNDDVIVVSHPQLGDLRLPRSHVREVSAPPSETADMDAGSLASAGGIPDPGTDEDEEEEKKGGLFGTRILRGWNSSLGAGLTGSQAGFEDTKLTVLFKTGIEDDYRRWIFDSAYFFNVAPKREDSGEKVTKNQGFAHLRRDWYFPEWEGWRRKVFAWVQPAYDYDDFQPWTHRVGAHLGPGYKLLNTEKWTLSPRLGFGVAHTFGSKNLTSPEGMLGFDLTWRPFSIFSFETKNAFYVDVTNAKRKRSVQSLDFRVKISEGFSWRLGTLYRFDKQSEGRANDVTYLSSLSYDF